MRLAPTTALEKKKTAPILSGDVRSKARRLFSLTAVFIGGQLAVGTGDGDHVLGATANAGWRNARRRTFVFVVACVMRSTQTSNLRSGLLLWCVQCLRLAAWGEWQGGKLEWVCNGPWLRIRDTSRHYYFLIRYLMVEAADQTPRRRADAVPKYRACASGSMSWLYRVVIY